MARSARASRFGTTLASCGGLILRVVSADSRRCGFGTTPGSCGELILWVASGGSGFDASLPPDSHGRRRRAASLPSSRRCLCLGDRRGAALGASGGCRSA